MKHKNSIFLFIFAVLIAALISSCDRDCPACPENKLDHVFYVSARIGNGHSMIKFFSVEQEKFVDSIVVLDMNIRDMAIVGNNEYLIATRDWSMVYDIRSRTQVKADHSSIYFVEMSPDDKYLATQEAGTLDFLIKEYNSGEIIYRDDPGGGGGTFAADSRLYIYPRDTSKVVFYDLVQDSVIKELSVTLNGQPVWVYRIWSVSNSKLYAITAGSVLHLCSIDAVSGEAQIVRAPLNTAGEYGCFSPDRNFFYFVNTPYTDFEVPSLKVEIYSTSSDALVDSISTAEYGYEPRGLAITNDGQYMMLVPYMPTSSDPWSVMLISLEDKSIIGLYDFGYLNNPEVVRY